MDILNKEVLHGRKIPSLTMLGTRLTLRESTAITQQIYQRKKILIESLKSPLDFHLIHHNHRLNGLAFIHIFISLVDIFQFIT